MYEVTNLCPKTVNVGNPCPNTLDEVDIKYPDTHKTTTSIIMIDHYYYQ